MSTEKVEKCSPQEVAEKIKVYSIRWLILGIFVAYSASSAIQWIQYSIISDVVTKYYDINSTIVDWTSMIYMVLYIVFVFPASYIMEHWGLRKTVLLGMTLTCVGAWIKLIAVQNSFWIAFLGQFVVASANAFVLSVPSRLAAVWFGPSEVALACSIGVFGNQLGIALGFLIPPMIVDNQSTREEQQQQFYILLGAIAGFTTVILTLVIIFFKNAPPTPPSHAALQQEMVESNAGFGQCLKRLVLNKSYMIVLVTYGINCGVFYAISTLLNQIIIHHYGDKAAADAGRIGLLIALAGMVGAIICGYILDRWRRYKETTLIVYALSLISMVIYSFTLSKGIYVVYVTSGLLGFFMTGLLPVGFELGVELTYPEPEGTSTGLLNLAVQVFGIGFTLFYSFLFTNVSDIWANLAMCIMLVIGTILLAFISSERRRQAALGS